MNKPLTIRELKNLCNEEIRKGNGDKAIMISDDDEGNGYHYLWYSFIEAKELVSQFMKEEDIVDSRVSTIDNTMILG